MTKKNKWRIGSFLLEYFFTIQQYENHNNHEMYNLYTQYTVYLHRDILSRVVCDVCVCVLVLFDLPAFYSFLTFLIFSVSVLLSLSFPWTKKTKNGWHECVCVCVWIVFFLHSSNLIHKIVLQSLSSLSFHGTVLYCVNSHIIWLQMAFWSCFVIFPQTYLLFIRAGIIF